MKILLADDDERILRLLSDYLSFNKLEVATATDGKRDLEIFQAEKIDLVILEVMMYSANLKTIRGFGYKLGEDDEVY